MHTTTTKAKATLLDTTKCIGCRSCQVTCKEWNDKPAELTQLNVKTANLQNPTTLSAKTRCLIQPTELVDEKFPGGMKWVFAKRQCMHCLEPACVAACPTTAMHKQESDGKVAWDGDKCIGCRYCQWACPWGVPMAEWDSLAPKIDKCTMCNDRAGDPACVKHCPAGALTYGDRDEMMKEAKARIARSPSKYVDHVYGEYEAGGTSMIYLASVPFEKLGFPAVPKDPLPRYSAVALGAVPPAVVALGATLGGVHALQKRKAEVDREEAEARAKKLQAKAEEKARKEAEAQAAAEHHPHFVRLEKKFWTPTTMLLLALTAFGGISFLARFALGLGATTGLSDTWAWGLWIMADLVWIAIAAGAFAVAGLIYVFQRKELYALGRTAVFMGLLSYTFVLVMLLADTGRPWNALSLVFNKPDHSAMYEVAWCVGLYVSILAAEFLPVAFEGLGLKRGMELWKKWAPIYVVAAVTGFVWKMSNSVLYAGLALAVFGLLAYAFRPREGQKPVPVMLAIAAVTLSTMHQSSLGSLFLLMPDKLDALWWTPILPLQFFVSSVAAGTAVVVLVELWAAKAWDRPLPVQALSKLGLVAWAALLLFEGLRILDLAQRHQLAAVLTDARSGLFLTEVLLGGAVPLVLLSVKALRERPAVLLSGTLLIALGVVLNRLSCTWLAMSLRGAMPQIAPQTYAPSILEWGVTIGLFSAAVLLFGLGARKLPVLEDRGHGQHGGLQ
jgi:formate dehydrogenase iron-sulfur subunit